ncbi:MAG TPA: hypothetical protein VFX16_08215 [Pseudonocardiaceae bacterium]|nr:hypothetical protein [Pseudonocardiaceae bacterium]
MSVLVPAAPAAPLGGAAARAPRDVLGRYATGVTTWYDGRPVG